MKITKKIAGVVLSMLMVCVICASFTSCKKSEKEVFKVGVLSYLNISEDDVASIIMGREKLDKLLEKEGYLTVSEKVRENKKFEKRAKPEIHYFDTLDALLMALKSGKIDAAWGLPQTTVKYICVKDDAFGNGFNYDFKKMRAEDDFANAAFNRLCDGFSFMFMNKNEALCDQFNVVIEQMKKDGSLVKLIDEQIISAMDGRELKVMLPEYKPDRDTIKVAVTGDLPPMDYISADGTFAGFNTALLEEIGRRLNKNIQLVQVSNLGRAAALASGTVDVAFWTRTAPFSKVVAMTTEEFNAFKEERRANSTEEEIEAMRAVNAGLRESGKSDIRNLVMHRDMPEGTIITIPYFTDMPIGIVLKK